MYGIIGSDQLRLSAAVAAAATGSARSLLGYSLSLPSSAFSSTSSSSQWRDGWPIRVFNHRLSRQAPSRRGMAKEFICTASRTDEPDVVRKIHRCRLFSRRPAEEAFFARSAYQGRLLCSTPLMRRRGPRVIASAPMTNSLKIEETTESAFPDFISDVSRTTTIAHKVWQEVVRSGDTVIDATCGNGQDTLTMAKLVLQEGTAGYVIGFDVQQSALDNTASLLDRELSSSQRDKVSLLQLCHSQLDKVVDENSVRLVAFNLGYQPGGDRSLITRADTTVKAVGAAVKVLEQNGLISIISYVGHPGGREEFEAVKEFVSGLPASDWVCTHLEWINRPLQSHLMFLLKK